MAVAPASPPPASSTCPPRSTRIWTAELDLALVHAFCRHVDPAGRPPARNFWPAVVRDMDVRVVSSSGDPREEDREACDSARHRLKRLRQYAAQISLILHHPSLAFMFDVSSGRLCPRAPHGHLAWSFLGNGKLRNRMRHGRFPWYPFLVPHLDQADLKYAQTTTRFTLPSPRGKTRRKKRSAAPEPDPNYAWEEPPFKRPSSSSPVAHVHPSPDAAAAAAAAAPVPASSTDQRCNNSPGPSPTISGTESGSMTTLPRTKPTWTTERDVALVQGYMAYKGLIPSDPTIRPASSVWRRIVQAVFGALSPLAEREAGDSARHRLRKLKEYGAQVHKLLLASDAFGKLFTWDERRSCLLVCPGRQVEATWAKIRNSQVRNRLSRAHYPWLRDLHVSPADLPSTFYSTTLGPEFFETSTGRNLPTFHDSYHRPLPLPPPSLPLEHPHVARSSSDSAPLALAPRAGEAAQDSTRLPSLASLAKRLSLPTLPNLPSVSSLTSRNAGSAPSARSPTASSPPAPAPAPPASTTTTPAPAPAAEDAGSVTRSSRIILTDVELGILPSDQGRVYLLLLPRLDAGQRELFASVRQYSPGQERVRAEQSYALMDTWLPAPT